MDTRMHYGPRDGRVLTMQSQHRSEIVFEGSLDNTLRGRRADGPFWDIFKGQEAPYDRPHPRVLKLLYYMGFYGVYRCGQFRPDFHLITALVERWRPETHTFHFRVGETTVTLQDVAVIWGLPIIGHPVVDQDWDLSLEEWHTYVQDTLGYIAEDGEIEGACLRTMRLGQFMKTHPVEDDSDEERVEQYARACVFMLLGGVMCPNTSGNSVPLLYLTILQDIYAVRGYSWGSAVLACLYRELCTSSNKTKSTIGGPLQLLQIWAWSRITPITPSVHAINVDMDEWRYNRFDLTLPRPPYGASWNATMSYCQTTRYSVRIFREILDLMMPHQFIWQPYDTTSSYFAELPEDCAPFLWTAICPLIFYAFIEWHYPDRVLRQFGMIQHIPATVIGRHAHLHKYDRRGRPGFYWPGCHAEYITAWKNQSEGYASGPHITSSITTDDGYMEWYDSITRRLISPFDSLQSTGYQPGDASVMTLVADQLASMEISVQSRPYDDLAACNTLLESFTHVSRNARNIINNRMFNNDQPVSPVQPVPRSQTFADVDRPTTSTFTEWASTSHHTRGGFDTDAPSTSHDFTPFTLYDHVMYTASGSGHVEPHVPAYVPPRPHFISPIPYGDPMSSAYRDVPQSTPSSSRNEESADHDSQTDASTQPIARRVRGRRVPRPTRCGTGGHLNYRPQ